MMLKKMRNMRMGLKTTSITKVERMDPRRDKLKAIYVGKLACGSKCPTFSDS